ncbi:CD209 antigen-like protein C isoform X2 [Octodon degus]|uniref:CD209 antigen-like protein C isoform X2 n=1 Tax=Octodon degus TaxID=10160 RepID=A0A6P6DLK1_OCTDE|nr:CD209 antigen-like protein C isoform X2 [Octodon degus]
MGHSSEWKTQQLGSKNPRSHQEKIYQELKQLKAGIDRLCRPCPWDWTVFKENCYFFSKLKKNWTDSVTACEEVEAQLVIVESAEEQSFLHETSKKKGVAWMGLSDQKDESTWSWVDGSPLKEEFTKYWMPGEPNNDNEEDCAEFRSEGWNNGQCELNKFWICKKPAALCP